METQRLIKGTGAAYLFPMSKISALNLIRKPGVMTLGIELPLDNDWSPEGQARSAASGRSRGVPDLSSQTELVRRADALGFSAVWARDVPVFDQINMGDAGSVNDVFTLLGFLDGRFVYPGSLEKLAQQTASWSGATSGKGAFIGAFHLDLLDDADVPPQPIRFGARLGRKALLGHFQQLAQAGVDHIAVNLRQSARSPAEVIEELAADVMPQLSKNPSILAA